MKFKHARRVLSSVLALVMLLSLLPVAAFSAENDGAPAAQADGTGDGLVLNKTATLVDDGTYTIQLEAFSTGKTLTVMKQTPTDIVLVLDMSGSMEETFTFATGNEWTSVTDYVRDMPDDAHHHCLDGTYSPVTWTQEGTTYRYTCNNCKATRKWSLPLWNKIPGEDSEDSWNLWRHVTKKEYKIDALQNAVKEFINGVATKNAGIADPDEQHRVAIVKFASEQTRDTIGNDTDKSGYNYTQTVAGLTTVTAESAADLNNKVGALKPGGATAADKGMEMAQGILANSGDRDTVVILFTDGDPNHGNGFDDSVANSAISTSKDLKTAGTIVYSVGLFTGANAGDTSGKANAYLNGVSSNYPEATAYTSLGTGGNEGYYKTCSQTANLTDIFREIKDSINTTTVTLNGNSEIRDVLNDGFVLTEKSEVTVQVDGYKGRDRDGNRVFNDTPSLLSATVTKDSNVVKVSGFDYSKEYLVDGVKPNDKDFTESTQGKKIIVTITCVEATDPAVTNGLVSTNDAISGIYQNAEASEPTAVFPQPQTQLSSKVYVLDYAKETALKDIPNLPSHMDASGMHWFNSPITSLTMNYGKANGTSYTPTTTLWNGYDEYYIFGRWNTTPEGVTTGDNTWTKVSVLPANNVYYEDTFVTNKSTGTVGIVYSPDGWETVSEGSNTGDASNNEHGWITSMDDDATYSDGTVATGSTAATFSFTGTGVDIYSRTDMTTGLVVAKLYEGTDTNVTAKLKKSLTVDNLAQSGEYYQIPTVSFTGLDHGTYTIKLTVASTDKVTPDERSTYYLDGIRVYNPLSTEQEKEDTVKEGYGDEIGASFHSVRDILIDAAKLNQEDPDSNLQGTLFIDYNPDTSTEGATATIATIDTYVDYGPKNEVYLAKDQAIAFNVGTEVTKLSVGLKAPNGATEVKFTNDENASAIGINAASDQYFEIAPNADGYVIIKNTGDNLLSVTKLKMSGDAPTAFSLDVDETMAYANSFDSLPVVAYTLMDSETDAPDTEETEEPEQPGEGDVVIENPEEPAPEDPPAPESNSWIDELIRAIRKIFRP